LLGTGWIVVTGSVLPATSRNVSNGIKGRAAGAVPSMKVIATSIPDVLIVEPTIFGDARGFFMETYQADRYAANGIKTRFVQDNLSRSARGVLRGLHIQNPLPQGKLVTALRGAVLDVAVDVRAGSPTFGAHVTVELNEENRRQLFVPRGFAHGFLVLSESADFFYKCDEFYSPADELVLRFDDPALGIDWGGAAPNLSARDRKGFALAQLDGRLPICGKV
jgi:dTDP-4-dehydrorhamnose 3,5-epimerase